ncbi:MAG TPA: hypothetical protein VGO40_14560 [Longimicrobium sp.]|jgi:hypothetical protein|nr:hypothetical protein [Longimicrobium sp.]
MQVSIIFSGACLFVPARMPDRMFVLLPASSDAMRHSPILEFDIAQLTQGNAETAKFYVYRSLRNRRLDLPGAGATLALCPEIVNLRDVTSSEVIPQLLTDAPGTLLASRVTLGAGANVAVRADACWQWNGAIRRIAHQVEWVFDSAEDHLDLTLTQLNPSLAEVKLPRLFPVGSTLRLFIYNVPPEELLIDPVDAEEPPLGSAPEHFGLMFPLFTAPVRTGFPLYAGQAKCAPVNCRAIVERGTPFTCLAGGVQP